MYQDDERFEEEQPKKKRFRLFDSQREGKGDQEFLPITRDLRGFFRGFGRNFTKLLRVNLLMILGNFPVIFALLALSGLFKEPYTLPLNRFFGDWFATMPETVTPGSMAQLGMMGVQIPNAALTTTSYVLFGLAALTFITFGFTKVGTTYILRSMIRGEPVFFISDFFYAIKRNKKQALFGIVDLLLILLIPYNFMLLSESGTSFLTDVMFWLNILIGVVYFFMRFYIYLQMITFDLKLGKILKNSLYFSLLGIKRNLLAALGIVLLVFLNATLLFGLGGILVPLGVALPLFLLFSASGFMTVFAAWFKIEEIMVAPSQSEEAE